VKVLDFGLAGQFEAGTLPAEGNLTGATLPGGTLRYMSPEQARGEALTPASDIFSFGLVLYEIATGQHAFPRDSAAEVMTAIVTEQVDAPPSVNPLLPRRLDSLILSMLAREPGARPSAEDVARTLAELQRPRESVVAVRRKKWIAAVVMLTLSTFAVWFWKYHGTAEKEPTFYQVTTLVPENRATAAAISPDAKWTAYANVDGIFLRSMRNGETEALRAPADFTVDHLAWFADGTKLVASGFSDTSYVPSVWTISAGGAPPCLLRGHARRAIPSPDGKHIAFISQDSSELWVMRSDGLEARRLVNAAGDMLPLLFWLPNGQRLGFQRHHIWAGHSMRSYQSVALTTGSIATLVRNIEMSSASMLPDGRLLYLQWDNWDFTTSRQLWEVRTDPLTGAFVERPQEIAALPGNNYTLLDLSVSADGKRAMVLRRSDENTVFVATLIDIRPASRISAG
jgi:hypothetical protein